MDATHLDRRRISTALLGISLGTLISGSVAQQRTQIARGELVPANAGVEHNRALDLIAKTLQRRPGGPSGAPLGSRDALLRIIDLLVRSKVITEDDGNRLKQIVAVLFEFQNLDAISERIQGIYRELAAKGSETAVAIASIVSASVEYVRKLGKEIDVRTALNMVVQDLTGAAAGAALAVFNPALGAICALGGAVAASALAVLGESSPAKPLR